MSGVEVANDLHITHVDHCVSQLPTQNAEQSPDLPLREEEPSD